MQQSCYFVAIYDVLMLQRLGTVEGDKGDLHVKQMDVDEETGWTPGWVRDNDCVDFGYGRDMASWGGAARKCRYEYQQDRGGVSADSWVR